ncbi:hypothetical protein T492DRAFT_353294 [Pavlovales sp. CCMP2436]|nr:hypothetical protein T492DRAFT_353294 [Pavlovales sp. CCMP2436]
MVESGMLQGESGEEEFMSGTLGESKSGTLGESVTLGEGTGESGVSARQLRVDIVLNHLPAVCNTAFLHSCLTYCPHAKPLCLAVGQWARAHGLTGESTGGISSYFWSLLVVRFLQVFFVSFLVGPE